MARIRTAILTVALVACFASPAWADLQYQPGATCLIRVTNGPGGDHLGAWTAGTLAGRQACTRAGTEIDREDRLGGYPERETCVCLGPDNGRNAVEGYALCRDMSASVASHRGPPNQRTTTWCDAVEDGPGRRIRVTRSQEDDNKPADPPWVSVWTERPGELGLFDIRQTNSARPGQVITFTMRIIRQTATAIRFFRSGANCFYNGVIAGTTMSGKYDCPSSGPGLWKADFVVR